MAAARRVFPRVAALAAKRVFARVEEAAAAKRVFPRAEEVEAAAKRGFPRVEVAAAVKRVFPRVAAARVFGPKTEATLRGPPRAAGWGLGPRPLRGRVGEEGKGWWPWAESARPGASSGAPAPTAAVGPAAGAAGRLGCSGMEVAVAGAWWRRPAAWGGGIHE